MLSIQAGLMMVGMSFFLLILVCFEVSLDNDMGMNDEFLSPTLTLMGLTNDTTGFAAKHSRNT
jgi:hypothetical protein